MILISGNHVAAKLEVLWRVDFSINFKVKGLRGQRPSKSNYIFLWKLR
jgi:hypothetical protein